MTPAALWAAGTVAGAAVAATLLVCGLRRRFCLVTVEGRSMAPACADGDVVLVRRLASAAIDRGQVVVVEKPGLDGLWRTPEHGGGLGRRRWMIKRAIATPGDPVPLDRVPRLAGAPGARVPAGMLVLLGDNAADSYDSRRLGYVPAARVLGVAVRQVSRGGRAAQAG